ncbi:MAG: hypothetical protein CVU39_06440 [Chloroflexi bacterium HGW-Chloroflexi-10]|nr:MAG: hypothetical protein CVU39_06440 [Chloroflexi bacterium HGW-Chloroflexi-10]
MSIRVGLYDFFAYTLPGIFYLGIIGFWLNVTGLLVVDLTTLKDFWGAVTFVIVAAGYIIGLLIDSLAYRWMRLFYNRNRDATKTAFDEYTKRHPWVKLNYEAKDWGILLRAVKSVSLEAAADVEQHNVVFIMLRNISLAFVFSTISTVVYYFVVLSNIWILALGIVFFVLAIVAMRRSGIRRHWFYMAVFEAFTAHFLLDEKAVNAKLTEKSTVPAPKSVRKASGEK